MPHTPRLEKLVTETKARVKEVSAAEARRLQEQGAMLIDVRDGEEFASHHAAGAVHVSRGVLELKIEQIAPDAATPIVCYCGGGTRSAFAADSLQQMGYTNVASMAGGYKAWRSENLPTE